LLIFFLSFSAAFGQRRLRRRGQGLAREGRPRERPKVLDLDAVVRRRVSTAEKASA
jgi:hypothetical protein